MRLILIPLLFMFTTARAQVQSSAYHLMLQTLLKHSVQEISVAELVQQEGVVLLDARAEEEYTVSHIAHALYVGYDDFDWTRIKSLKKDQTIVVYCSVGYRSEKIAEKLIAAGYTRVENLYGGIFEWVNQGNEVVDATGKKTDAIHAYSKTWGLWLNKGKKVYGEP